MTGISSSSTPRAASAISTTQKIPTAWTPSFTTPTGSSLIPTEPPNERPPRCQRHVEQHQLPSPLPRIFLHQDRPLARPRLHHGQRRNRLHRLPGVLPDLSLLV